MVKEESNLFEQSDVECSAMAFNIRFSSRNIFNNQHSRMNPTRLLFLLLAAPLLHAEESIPTPAQYSCADENLENSLADLKAQAEGGNISAAAQVYAAYARNRHRAQAEAWYNRWLQLREEEATKGNTEAMREVGALYLRGDVYLQPNPQRAVTLLSQAVEAGDASAAILLGEHFSKTAPEDSKLFYAKAYSIYKAIGDSVSNSNELQAEQRHALEMMGDMELSGIGTELLSATGIAHLEQAGTPTALMRLFQVYVKGIGVEANMLKALEYARLLADMNPKNAHTGQMAWVLADAYLNGKYGLEANPEQGHKYLDIADSENIAPAIYCKALLQQKEGQHKQALINFSRAASMGNPEAAMHAALIQLHGAEGVQKNEEIAIESLKRIADRFNEGNEWYVGRAPYELALYYDRSGAKEQADLWYRIASDRNVVEAMARRGLCHIIPGGELEWSPTAMFKWWKIGSEAGDATCSRYLNIFIWGVVPGILLLVFGLPVLIVHILNKRNKD